MRTRSLDARLRRLESDIPIPAPKNRFEGQPVPKGAPEDATAEELAEWVERVAVGCRETDDTALDLAAVYIDAFLAAEGTPGWDERRFGGLDPAKMAAGEKALRARIAAGDVRSGGNELIPISLRGPIKLIEVVRPPAGGDESDEAEGEDRHS